MVVGYYIQGCRSRAEFLRNCPPADFATVASKKLGVFVVLGHMRQLSTKELRQSVTQLANEAKGLAYLGMAQRTLVTEAAASVVTGLVVSPSPSISSSLHAIEELLRSFCYAWPLCSCD